MISSRQFGSSLRRHREGRNITLKGVEARTKIAASLLSALEKGDCSRWPAGIYSRSWIRAYADAVGLDPDETAAQFARCFAEIAFPDAPARSEAAQQQRSPLRLGLEPEPRWPVRELLRRAAYWSLDLTIVLLLATAATFAGLSSLLAGLAAAALTVHTLAVLAGQGSASRAVHRSLVAWRDSVTGRTRDATSESAFAEVA